MKDGRILSADTESAGKESQACMPPGDDCGEAEHQLTVTGHLVHQRNPENLEAVAQAFNIPVHVTASITDLLQKLFDDPQRMDRQEETRYRRENMETQAGRAS